MGDAKVISLTALSPLHCPHLSYAVCSVPVLCFLFLPLSLFNSVMVSYSIQELNSLSIAPKAC